MNLKAFSSNNRFVFFLLAFIEGGAVMSIELLAGRMIAPAYGTSLFVWTTVLGVAVGGLALGYFTGGRMADKYKQPGLLYIILLIAAMLIIIMPRLAATLTLVMEPAPLMFSVFCSALLFLFPPVLLLGATTPIIIRSVSDGASLAGKSSGIIYGISTVGGIFSTFLVGFFLLPEYGLTITAIYTGLVLAVLPFFILIINRVYYLPIVFFVFNILIFFPASKKPESPGIKVLYESEGLLGQLLVVDMPKKFNPESGSDRVLFVNRMGQTWIDKSTGNSAWSYVNYVTSAASILPKNQEVLLLGLGGGTVAKQLEQELDANIDAVELDERIVEIARELFGLGSRTNVIIDDARHFIRSTDKKYDLFVFDVFKGEVPPSHVLSLECFKEVKQKLNNNGLMIINFNGFIEGEAGRAGRSILKTILAAGFNVKVLPTFESEEYRNILYLASVNEFDFSNVGIKLNIQDGAVNIPDLFVDLSTIDMEDAVILTDDKPVLEILNLKAAESWRKSYGIYTKKFREQGIPIFK